MIYFTFSNKSKTWLPNSLLPLLFCLSRCVRRRARCGGGAARLLRLLVRRARRYRRVRRRISRCRSLHPRLNTTADHIGVRNGAPCLQIRLDRGEIGEDAVAAAGFRWNIPTELAEYGALFVIVMSVEEVGGVIIGVFVGGVMVELPGGCGGEVGIRLLFARHNWGAN